MWKGTAPLAFAALALASRPGAAGDEPPDPRLAAAVAPLVDGSAELGWELHRRCAQPGKNALLSPLSITLALAMLREGATGDTAAEMDRVLHLRMADLGGSVGRLRLALEESVGDRLLVANGLWHRADSPPKEAYRRRLLEHYGVEPRAFDPKVPQAAVADVNRWVAERTKNRIQDLLPADAIGSLTEAVLANAIYFRAEWRKPFDVESTKPRPFSLSPDVAVDVPTMHAALRLPYAQTADATVVELPYRGDRLSMLVVLPKTRHGLAALEERLAASPWAAWSAAVRPRDVHLRLPRFSFASKPDLMAALLALGLRSPFEGGEFGGLSDASFAVGDVVHAATIDVEESGTTAAAVTVLSVSRGGDDFDWDRAAEFVADQPFLFAIREVRTGAILFVGRICDPR